MQKKLMSIGNSVALIIDKPLRHALGIKPTTLVRVTTDGRCLIVEPCGERTMESKRAADVTQQQRAAAIAWSLLTYHSLGNNKFVRLSSGWPALGLRVLRYEQWTKYTKWEHITDAERRVVRRFAALHEALSKECPFEDALRAALVAEPFDPDDPDEKAAGVDRAFAPTPGGSSAPSRIRSCR